MSSSGLGKVFSAANAPLTGLRSVRFADFILQQEVLGSKSLRLRLALKMARACTTAKLTEASESGLASERVRAACRCIWRRCSAPEAGARYPGVLTALAEFLPLRQSLQVPRMSSSPVSSSAPSPPATDNEEAPEESPTEDQLCRYERKVVCFSAFATFCG